MATSGSKNYSITAIEVIGGALRKLGAFDHGEAIPAEEVQDGMQALNLLIKEWSSAGIDIFVRDQITVWLDPNKADPTVYRIASVMPDDHNTASSYAWADDVVMAGDTTLTTAAADVAAGDGFVRVPNGATRGAPIWTANTDGTVNNLKSTSRWIDNQPTASLAMRVKASSDTSGGNWPEYFMTWAERGIAYDAGDFNAAYEDVAFSSPPLVSLPPSPWSAAAGTPVLFGQRAVRARPVELLYCMRRDPDNGQDVPVTLMGENEYQRLGRKTQTGPTTQVYYEPMDTYGLLHVWPVGDDNYPLLIAQARFYADDIDTTTQDAQFPIEWGNALIFNLAHDLAPEYGVDQNKRSEMFLMGQKKLNDLLDKNQENANVVFTIDNQRAR